MLSGSAVNNCACRLLSAVTERSATMFDLFMTAIGFGLFALSVVYAYACDRL
jgi:hypothetical protein